MNNISLIKDQQKIRKLIGTLIKNRMAIKIKGNMFFNTAVF